MFGLGMPEILLILAIALIVIGPQKLPELAKTLGRAMGEFKRSAQDLKRSIDIESTVNDPVPPPASKKIREIVKDVNETPSSETDPPKTDTGNATADDTAPKDTGSTASTDTEPKA